MKKNKLLVLGIVVVVLALVAANSLFTVNQTKQAIVLQFGDAKRVIKKPGLAFKIPLVQNVLFYDNRVMVAHLGDSRLYRLRGEEFEQLTRDHSLLQEQIDSGLLTAEQAKTAQHKNLVTRALGIDLGIEPEIREYSCEPGDIYLLCSDGLCDMVSDEDIGMALEALGANLELAAQQLVQMANDNGGRDNVSVILVRVLREYPAARGVMARFFAWLK